MFLEVSTHNRRKGWVEVITGSMFSGKTEELIRRLKRAKIAKQQTIIFKPKDDVRYSDDSVVSHDEKTVSSTTVSHSSEILSMSKAIDVVGIDEVQFFDDGIITVCNELANRGIRVIVAGLDMNFRGEPFDPMPQLLAIAEYVTKVHAICVKCGNLAQYSHRLICSDKLVELGGKESYEPLCRECYITLKKIE